MNLAATARRAALAAASALVLAGTVAPVADAAAPTPAAPAPETCRDVAVVAARGTDQTDPDFGDEGETLRGLLDLAEARHPGLSSRAELIALDREVYPATLGLPQLAEEGEQLSPADTARRALEVIPELGQVHATDPRATIEALPGHLERREAETGCRPDYVLLGYSQGATVLTGLEARLHAQGRLRGVIYLGDPHAPCAGCRSSWAPRACPPARSSAWSTACPRTSAATSPRRPPRSPWATAAARTTPTSPAARSTPRARRRSPTPWHAWSTETYSSVP